MKRLALPSSLSLSVTGCLWLAACGGHHQNDGDGPKASEYLYDCQHVPAGMTAFATDESFAEFINKEAAGGLVVSDAQAPTLTAPAAGATLSASVPPAVALAVTVATRTPGGVRIDASPAAPADRDGAQGSGRSRARRSLWASVRRWFSIEGTAWAHCGAVSSDNFLFRLSRGTTPVYTAWLSVTTFTPSADVWKAAMKDLAGQTLTATVARAEFSNGRIAAGPFVPTAAPTFVVGP